VSAGGTNQKTHAPSPPAPSKNRENRVRRLYSEHIRDAAERRHPLGDEAFIKRGRAEWKAQKAQPLAQPPETVINLEMTAT